MSPRPVSSTEIRILGAPYEEGARRAVRSRRAPPIAGALAILALFAIPACGPAPTPVPPPNVTHPPPIVRRDPNAPVITILATPRAPEPASRAPFAKAGVIAPSNEALSKWPEPPLSFDTPHLWSHFVTSGVRAAVVRRGASLFVVHLDRGVTGPLALPEGTFWIGLDGDDALYAARADGTLLRARDLAKATEQGNFEPIVSIPSAVAWDVTEGLLVAAGGGHVFASTDGGASFRYTALPEKQAAAQIVARDDGTVVVVAHGEGDARKPSVWISNDRAATLHASTFQPRSVHREGARIGGQQGGCEGLLGGDGATWILDEGSSAYRLRSAWESALEIGAAPRGHAPEHVLNAHEPAAPPRGPAWMVIGSDGKCPTKPKGGSKGGGGLAGIGVGMGGFGVADEGVFGVERSLPRPPSPSRTSWGFLGDGTCAAADVDTQWGDRWCKRDRPLTRLPRVARTDALALTLDVLDVPPDCSPDTLLSARGTAVLACRSANGDRALYLAGRDGRWYAEGSVACSKELRLFDAKSDGTLALSCARDLGEYDLWVRRPASLGTQGALRKVVVPDALAYRLLDAGRAVAVTTRGKRGASLSTIGLGALGRGGSAGDLDSLARAKPKQGTTPPKTSLKDAKKGAPPPKKTPLPKEDPGAMRERHTFSVVEDSPDSGQTVLARDLYVADELAAFSTTDTEVYFRVEKHKGGRFGADDDDKTARYVVLDRKRLRDVPKASAPADIVLTKSEGLSLSGSFFSFAMTGQGTLASDATHLYWADTAQGQILRVPRAGGSVEVLADGLASPFAIALDEARVIFTTLGAAYGEPGGVFVVPKAGGSYSVLASAELRPIAVAADATAVYWLSQGLERSATGALRRYPKDGSPPTVLLDRLAAPRAMALAGSRIFVSSGMGDVWSVGVTGGARARIGSRGSPVTSLLVGAGELLWTDSDEPAIAQAPLTGGPATLLSLTRETGSLLAGSASDLWLAGTSSDTLSRLPAGADHTETTASDLKGPTDILVDDAAVYVRESNGSLVRRLPRGKGPAVTLYERKTP